MSTPRAKAREAEARRVRTRCTDLFNTDKKEALRAVQRYVETFGPEASALVLPFIRGPLPDDFDPDTEWFFELTKEVRRLTNSEMRSAAALDFIAQRERLTSKQKKHLARCVRGGDRVVRRRFSRRDSEGD